MQQQKESHGSKLDLLKIIHILPKRINYQIKSIKLPRKTLIPGKTILKILRKDSLAQSHQPSLSVRAKFQAGFSMEDKGQPVSQNE